ncbi:MAG: glycerol kinase GlpK [Firmicutes bacterium]|nr:glycerol kinase GlpK [Bacillota bacterium]
MAKYIMALDQGTTSSRCILFDHNAQMVSVAQKEYRQIFPQPGYVEHDPNDIWASQLSVAMEAMAQAGIRVNEIAAIGITNQRETTIVWDKATGKPVYNAIVWQCRRTADRVSRIYEDGFDKTLTEKTGLIPDPYFSATKLEWILDHVPGSRERAERGELLFGTVDTWLLWNLTGGSVFATDVTNASRTMLYNIHTLEWDEEILNYFRIPRQMLPEVKDSSCIFGHTSEKVLGGEVPIGSLVGDQQGSLFGQCCFTPGSVKNTYGTGCFLLMNTGSNCVASKNRLLTTIAVGENGKVQYALEGSVFVGGAVIQWLRDEMRLFPHASDSERYARAVPDTAGVYLVPAFTGLAAPFWDPYARGTVVGLTRGCTKDHFIRAALESIAYQSYDVFDAMQKDTGMQIRNLKVDGGASANEFLMQFQADLIQGSVVRCAINETTALGAAYLAGLACGFWKDKEELTLLTQSGKTYVSGMDRSEQEQKLRGWHKAVARSLQWAKEDMDE